MTGFQRFSWGQPGGVDPAKPAGVGDSELHKPLDHKDREFHSHPKQEIISLARKKKDSFNVDSQVAEQLGLEERERMAIELRIKAELERRWEKTKDQAEAAGFQQGLAEGIAEAYKAELPRINEKLEKLNQLWLEFDQLKGRIFTVNEAFLMRIIAQVSKAVLLREIAIDKEYVQRLVVHVLEQLGKPDDTRIYLSSADIQNLAQLKDYVEKNFGSLKHTTIEEDSSLTEGSCRVETSMGVIDASLDTQIQNIIKSLSS